MIHIFLFIIGTCIGSFLNVMFSRRDWYKGRSRCDNCGYTLKWYDLIPIVSYLFLGGRCRKCKMKINKEHLICELLMGCTFLCASFSIPQFEIWNAVLLGTGLFVLSVGAIEDIKEQMILLRILYGGIIVTYAVKLIPLVINSESERIAEIISVVVLIYIAAFLINKLFPNKIGEGDIDLFVIMYGMLGMYNAVLALTIGCAVGCVIYLPLILLGKYKKDKPLPFAPLLLVGTLVTTFII